MKPQVYGIIGIVLGLLAFVSGFGMKSDLAAVSIFGGIFIFGCGLIAAAIGAKK
jgi:hypothetical protein